MFLGQHKWHEIDFAKSSGAHDTVVAMPIVFLIVRAKIEKKKKRESKLGWQARADIAHTKCLIVVPIPPFWTPFTN